MSLESVIEKQIREAIERGEFDDLEGKGKPIDLTVYFNTPEDLRMAYSLLRSNKFVPEEVELMREIEQLREKTRSVVDEKEKAALNSKLNEKTLALNVAIERYKRRR